MNPNLSPVLRRLRGNYLPIIYLYLQLFWLPFLALGMFLFWLNTNLPNEQLLQLGKSRLPVLLFLQAIFLVEVLYNSRFIIQAINRLAANQPLDATLQAKAWRQLSFLARRYMTGNGLIAFILTLSIYFNVPRVPFISSLEIFYLIFAAGAALTLAIQAGIILMKSLIRPVIRALRPDDTREMLAYMRPSLYMQMFAVALGLVITSLLALSSIGHRQTYLVLYREIGSAQVLQELIIRSFGASFVILLLSLLYIRRFSYQAFSPLRKMIDLFQKIEAGDLTQRMEISSLDEIGMLGTYFNRMIERLQALQETLEERVRIRTAQLETVNAISQASITILEPQKLIEQFVKQITDAFGYYLVAIYLTTDDQKWVEIQAASGETGKVLVLRKQRYLIDASTPIGKAIQLQQRQVINYESGNPPETFLPYTRSEIVFPLIVGKRVLGALDIHATQENTFDTETLGILQNIANQISVALANAETFKKMQETLEELESSQRLYMKTAWEDALTEHRELSYRLGAHPNERIEGTQLLNVPISLREQILGEILIEGHNLSDEDRAWVEAIATQAAVALENVRLLEDSQRTALQERLTTEIIQRIWRARTIDGVLQTAVREIGQALQASEATIELYPANGEEA